jgi:hypothetical protein
MEAAIARHNALAWEHHLAKLLVEEMLANAGLNPHPGTIPVLPVAPPALIEGPPRFVLGVQIPNPVTNPEFTHWVNVLVPAYVDAVILWDAELEAHLEALANLGAAEAALAPIRYEYYNIVLPARIEAIEAYNEIAALYYGSVVAFQVPNNNVSPGSVIYGEFTLRNTSSIPTHFRVTTPDISATGNHIFTTVAIIDGTSYPLELGADNKYYAPVAIPVGTNIEIVIGAYFYGEQSIYPQGGSITISEVNVELIQAANNAAYFAWRADAGFGAGFWR